MPYNSRLCFDICHTPSILEFDILTKMINKPGPTNAHIAPDVTDNQQLKVVKKT